MLCEGCNYDGSEPDEATLRFHDDENGRSWPVCDACATILVMRCERLGRRFRVTEPDGSPLKVGV